jgi:hypothetical protein
MPTQTRRTPTTNPTNPLYTHPLTYFDSSIFSSGAHSDDFAYAFVATDLAWLSGVRECFPGVCHDAEVAVADAGVGEVDEDFARAGGGCVEFDYFCADCAGGVVDDCFVFLGDFGGRHCCCGLGGTEL